MEGKKTSGHGLGLYLSLKLAQYFNGDINVESEQGIGTIVRVSILVELNSSTH